MAAEYGWTHTYILDNMNMSQINMYVRYAMCRIDEDKKHAEELSIIASGGDIKQYRSQRKTLREILKSKAEDGKKPAPQPEQDAGPSREGFSQMAASLGFPLEIVE